LTLGLLLLADLGVLVALWLSSTLWYVSAFGDCADVFHINLCDGLTHFSALLPLCFWYFGLPSLVFAFCSFDGLPTHRQEHKLMAFLVLLVLH